MFTGDNVGLILSIAAPCFLIYLVFHTGMAHDDFKKNGIRTIAKINNIKQISTSGTGSPKCVFMLSFTTQDGQEITLEKTQVVSVLDMMPLERERKVNIYYKKENLKKVWLILESESRIK
ncbi:hypothetical protein BBB57_01795 [Kosakonia sacchari]|uniref:hypothetical protein n=1 Tax=Kosakonia sacchari TaxID=1158459 RepID=UPI0008074B37|nr:hypothetical protein [Kosakonia sacchari]ANR77098.1 hypothetical protein BBB57_01795 [Kosakonia sacchari]